MNSSNTFSVYCNSCKHTHQLSDMTAKSNADNLLRQLESNNRLDFEHAEANPIFNTEYLYGPARGQMFGVLACEDLNGKRHYLKAFSGQYNGRWLLNGWAPPVFNLEDYDKIMIPGDVIIKKFDHMISEDDSTEEQVQRFKKQRKELSQALMKDIHQLYQLQNYRENSAPLTQLFDGGIPTGTADCCAPKLLQWAYHQKLKPLGLAEFYFGKTNKSKTRKHGEFYPPCKERCKPILGFMLCGIEDEDA